MKRKTYFFKMRLSSNLLTFIGKNSDFIYQWSSFSSMPKSCLLSYSIISSWILMVFLADCSSFTISIILLLLSNLSSRIISVLFAEPILLLYLCLFFCYVISRSLISMKADFSLDTASLDAIILRVRPEVSAVWARVEFLLDDFFESFIYRLSRSLTISS